MKNFLRKQIIVFLFLGLIPLVNLCKNKPAPIILVTENVTEITQTSAISGGNITCNDGSVSARGVCWSTEAGPDLENYKTNNGSDTGSFASFLIGLKPGTDYYVRAYATTSEDTIYGSAISFTTSNFGTVTDIEGNVYKIITIGTQTWMADNLKSSKYYDDLSIPLVEDDAAWAALSSPGYCWYKNDETSFKTPYGALYNWYAVNSGKLCPTDWHVPNETDWNTLETYLGGENIAGGNLKETGTDYWVDPNTGATNIGGFSALPGGFRHSDGKFFDFGFSGYWWSSKQYISTSAYFRFIHYNESPVFRLYNLKKNGFSVRCLKD